MRPEKIELQYFGPYEHETVDFSQFKDRSLFLVAGNTGAGKTTIFDAMCYALFGQTTNEHDRSAGALRSDFAPVDQATKVTFIFSHQGQSYKITREPKQRLRGRRGKWVDHAQKVSLVYSSGSDQHEITKVGEAERFITNLLNMTRDQFRQIVLLPQGKFRQFLDSDSNAKEALLRDLFQTRKFADWVARLKDQLKKQRKELDTQLTKLQTQKENITAVDSQLPVKEWQEAVKKLINQLKEQLTTLKDQEKGTQEIITALNRQLRVAEELQRALTDLAKNRQVATTLIDQRVTIDKYRQQVTDLKWFQAHQTTYQQYLDIQQEVQQRQSKVVKLQVQINDLRVKEKSVQQTVTTLTNQQVEIENLRNQIRDLTVQLPLFKQVHLLTTTVNSLQKQVNATKQGHETAQQAVRDINQQLAELQEQLIDNEKLTSQLVNLEKRRNNYQQLRQLQAQLTSGMTELSVTQRHLKDAQQAFTNQQEVTNKLEQQVVDLRDIHARQQIALLANDLKPGSPCPVCGALEHPHPAKPTSSETMVTDDQIKTAYQKWQEARKLQEQCQEQLSQEKVTVKKVEQSINEQQQKLVEQLNLPKLPHNWQTQIELVGQQLATDQNNLDKQSQRARQQRKDIDHLQEQLIVQQKRVQVADEDLHSQQQKLVQRQTELAGKSAQLPEKFHDQAEVESYVQAGQQRITDFDHQLTSAQNKLTELQQQLAISQDNLQQNQQVLKEKRAQQASQRYSLTTALTNYRSGLEWAFWEHAKQGLQQLPALNDRVTDYDNQVRDNRLEQQRLQKLIAGRNQPDITRLQQKLVQQNQQLSTTQQAIGKAKSQTDHLLTITKQVEKLERQIDHANTSLADLQTLVDVVDGNTESKLSLERYVLQAYFKDVLVAANVQLQQLTNGRYQFELSQDNHGAGTKWSGLEINVYDDNAGRSRSARTLSGGESFIASLALALALCQIIQEQSGGIQIDALFIDEGFGSLDQTALSDALRTLEELEGHRMIGIISHVTELEEQIPDQLRVTSTNGRSTVSYRHDL